MQTNTRRLLQPIWNLFDEYLSPFCNQGLGLCVSGGADSRALMEIVAIWPNRFEKIEVFSLDHQVRLESALEVKLVCSRARVLGFNAHGLKAISESNIKLNEADLRQIRYTALWKQANQRGFQVLVTGHNKNDQAENFVMNLVGLRGGKGGAGMPASLKHKKGHVVRPLLGFSKAYLIACLTALGVKDYFTDPSNLAHPRASRSAVRNFLSLHRMPVDRFACLAEERRSSVCV